MWGLCCTNPWCATRRLGLKLMGNASPLILLQTSVRIAALVFFLWVHNSDASMSAVSLVQSIAP